MGSLEDQFWRWRGRNYFQERVEVIPDNLAIGKDFFYYVQKEQNSGIKACWLGLLIVQKVIFPNA